MSENAIVCPNCQRIDAVRRLRDHYQEIAPPPDPEKSTNNNPWGSQENTPKTLAEKLAPPEEPAKDFYMAIWAIIPFVPILNLVFIWMAPMARFMKRLLTLSGLLLALSILGYFFHPASMDPAHFNIGPFNVNNAPAAVLILILVVYYSGLLVERAQRKSRFEKETYPIWQKSLAAWEHLYYCTDCEGAFAADQPRFAKADEIGVLIETLN
ncbi:MAG: hypothetical protein ACM3UZ_13160 [Acidobacteriota bacterium]